MMPNRTGGLPFASTALVRRGSIASRKGKAIIAPAPRKALLLEIRVLLLNIIHFLDGLSR
jgi:hypothetical protein